TRLSSVLSLTTEVANYRGTNTYGDGSKGDYRDQTTPVDHFDIANDFGLCEMHGNVWEWCQDIWHDNYEEAPIDGSAWMTDGDDRDRILRGGSWLFNPENCRSACRYHYQPSSRYDSFGFRVVSAPGSPT
ncbi:MAG: formylglycine-generating enzyme family protein, partial [Leptolyngbyaceae cyanobacterium]